MNRLRFSLERSGAVICLDAKSAGLTQDGPSVLSNEELDRRGILAVIKVALSDAPPDSRESSKKPGLKALQMSANLSSPDGSAVYLPSPPAVPLLTPVSGQGSEEDRTGATDLALAPLADNILKAVRSLVWHAHVVSVDNGRVFINAGTLSGIKEGDVLEAYGPGEQVVDKATGQPLGRLKGIRKGDMKISEVFGPDASWASASGKVDFSPGDFVYLAGSRN